MTLSDLVHLVEWTTLVGATTFALWAVGKTVEWYLALREDRKRWETWHAVDPIKERKMYEGIIRLRIPIGEKQR